MKFIFHVDNPNVHYLVHAVHVHLWRQIMNLGSRDNILVQVWMCVSQGVESFHEQNS